MVIGVLLRNQVWRNELGAVGRWLFRVRFLDSEYAAMMTDVLNGYKQDAQARPVLQKRQAQSR